MGQLRPILAGLASLTASLWLSSPAHASLAEVAVSTALAGEGLYGSAAIDTADREAFFGSSSSIVLPPFTSTSSLVSLYSIPDLHVVGSTLSYTAAFMSFSSFTNITAAAFDPTTGFGYFANGGTPAGIEKLAVSPLAILSGVAPSSATLGSGHNSVGTGVIDPTNQFGYFGTRTSPSIVVKVRLSDLAVISTITLPSALNFLSASVIDTGSGFAYFASSTTPGGVAKIRLSDFTLQGTLSFNAGEGGVGSAVIDAAHQLAYFGTHDYPGKVVEVQLASLVRVSALTLPVGQSDLTSAVADPANGMAYFGTNTSTGIVAAVVLSNLSELTSLTLGKTQNFLRSAVIDTANEFAYFGTYNTPGQVIQVDLLAGLPTILTQPSAATAHPGDTVTFSVTATARNLSYQWQLNGAAIAGATSASYSRTALSTDDGSSFNCVVTGANGSITSNSATLTIIPVIRAFPNPWRSDRHTGLPITFDGLLANSTVKIFNLAVHWVRTLPVASGTTTWDLKNDAGQQVASGYYFYVVTTGNSQQTVHGEIAVIH